MQRKKAFFVCTIALMGILGACSRYDGDGKYKKYSLFGNWYRHEVDFGTVDLLRQGEYVYSFSGIPRSSYRLCLEIGPYALGWDEAGDWDTMPSRMPFGKASVSMILSDEKNRTVVAADCPLSDPCWHWTGRRDSNFPAPGQGTALHTFLIYPANAKEFRLSPRESYTIKLAVSDSFKGEAPAARLLLQGGFWK